jgi:hypothetical protein
LWRGNTLDSTHVKDKGTERIVFEMDQRKMDCEDKNLLK